MTEDTQQSQSTEQGRDTLRDAFNSFLDHNRRAAEETGKAFDALIPDEFREHSAAARDELRKGLKVLVDATIDELEKMTKIEPKEEKSEDSKDDEPPSSTTGRTKVKVQVE